MSRTLSLATLALCATLLAVPAMPQQPAGKDSSKAAATKHHSKRHAKKHEVPPRQADTTPPTPKPE